MNQPSKNGVHTLTTGTIGKTGGGKYNPSDRFIYFIAANCSDMEIARKYHKYCLIAMNELEGEAAQKLFVSWLSEITLLLDSGVFNLASTFARDTGISHDEALKTPLAQIPGFQSLRERYLRIVTENEPNLWGYIELDIGGTDQKRKTRAELEALGLRPIPVYHPLNDGWDYFDELASKYDRMCVGNIVQASRYIRLRLLATINERRKKYPNLRWVHLLGMTPNEWANAYPMESMDSTSWLQLTKWVTAWRGRACLKPVSGFSEKYTYILGDSTTFNQAKAIAVIEACGNQMNWRERIQALPQETVR